MAGNDSYTVSLLHMDGADASTTFTDSAVGGTHTWTARGTAQIDTAQSKFGGASGLFDGNSDWVDTPTSTDFKFGTDPFTVDFQIKFNSTANQQGIFGCRAGANDLLQLWFFGNTVSYKYKWSFYQKDSSVVRAYYIITNDQSDPSTDWHHVAWVRDGGAMYFFLDGVSIALTETTEAADLNNIAAVYTVGMAYTAAGSATYFNGWIDELRISKGVARWTSNFTPPVAEYTSDVTGHPAMKRWGGTPGMRMGTGQGRGWRMRNGIYRPDGGLVLPGRNGKWQKQRV